MSPTTAADFAVLLIKYAAVEIFFNLKYTLLLYIQDNSQERGLKQLCVVIGQIIKIHELDDLGTDYQCDDGQDSHWLGLESRKESGNKTCMCEYYRCVCRTDRTMQNHVQS